MNAYYGDLDFRFPQLATPMAWEALVDTSRPTGRVENGGTYAPGEFYRMRAHSFALFINRAPRREPAVTKPEAAREPKPEIAALLPELGDARPRPRLVADGSELEDDDEAPLQDPVWR